MRIGGGSAAGPGSGEAGVGEGGGKGAAAAGLPHLAGDADGMGPQIDAARAQLPVFERNDLDGDAGVLDEARGTDLVGPRVALVPADVDAQR